MELAITTDGAFATPFGPTVKNGKLQTDMLVTRTTSPLSIPLEAMLGIVSEMPEGHDAATGIR